MKKNNSDSHLDSKISNFENINFDQNNQNTLNKHSIYSWGFGKYGQIGQKLVNYSLIPLKINFDSEEITKIYCGEAHSSLLSKKGNIYMFGKNIFGQLGLKHNNYIFIPTLLNINSIKIKKVSLGGEHSLILSDNKILFSFGLNYFGQLGLGDNQNRNIPTKVNINIDNDDYIKDFKAGSQFSIILTNKNLIFSCGFSKTNATGFGICEDINFFSLVNVNLQNENEIIFNKIRTGTNHTLILYENYKKFIIFGIGDVLKFNDITSFELKNIINNNNSKSNFIKNIKIGDDFIILLTNEGKIYSMGLNNKGQLGLGNYENSLKFNEIKLNEKVKKIKVGYEFSFILTENYKLFGFGSNEYGQLCSKEKEIFNEPTLIHNFQNLKMNFKLNCGGYHCLSLINNNNNIDLITYFNHFNNNKENNSLINNLNTNIENDLPLINNKLNNFKKAKDTYNELTIKNSILEKQIEKLKEKEKNLGVIPKNDLSSYCRNFSNDFEIDLKEIYFDESIPDIGKGTFGEVKRGIWRGEEVAVKFLKTAMLTSKESIKNFVDECNIMKHLHHPNILLFMGANTKGPDYFVVSEYCPNGNLFELLHMNQNHVLHYDDIRRIALQIAYGINYLHSYKPPILHRDLKSMNVLLDKNFQVKLADFGNTKKLDVQMTKQKGTFQWMAPEVIKGKDYTEKSDVFSFGIIMNELVTRVPPYQGTDKRDVARKVVNNPDYRPPLNKKVPKDWADLMKRCYEHDDKKRPTFNEIIECLKKANLSSRAIMVGGKNN